MTRREYKGLKDELTMRENLILDHACMSWKPTHLEAFGRDRTEF